MRSISVSRKIARLARATKAWRPATLAALSEGVMHRQRNAEAGFSERAHLQAAAEWLARAQDSQPDGGVSGRYHLGTGWSSSYPETTGYIIPTLLALDELGLRGYRERAQRCVQFLLGVQLPSGAFPGMEIADNREQASTFNSAQILNGLTAWHRATGDAATLQAAHRVADWLIGEQDPDGAWRKHLYGSGKTYTYMAHAGCWIAEFGAHVGDARYLDAARRHLHWVLSFVDDETGWINDCGFSDGTPGERDAVTHTIAYTIWGILLMSRLLNEERGLAVAQRAARAVARRVELSKGLPGRLNAQWKPASNFVCLTGNAQMALIWFELHRLESDPLLLNAALVAIDQIKRAQNMHSSDPGIRGGVGGSDPLWGSYITHAIPNWAAKFYIDALLEKSRTLRALDTLPCRVHDVPPHVLDGVPVSLPESAPGSASGAAPRIVLLADWNNPKVEQFVTAWQRWGFKPDAVVVRTPNVAPRSARLHAFVRDHGVLNLARRFAGTKSSPVRVEARQGTIVTSGVPVSAFCATQGIETLEVTSFESPAELARMQALKGDLFVYAGAGIMRAALLALPTLGTVNAHMGILPQMRGCNVAEWSVFIGAQVGCTVHLIDPGIDTGDILLVTPVDIAGAPNVDSMRQRVDVAQIEALGRVVRWIREHKRLPPVYPQRAEQGRQYFRMHDELREILQSSLRGAATSGIVVRPTS